ncbi:MAG: hypothetical protein JNK74_25165 [Candidatus Hydrogenedentes bacterium]|nr:hypothetical protein [Candidatus Hydrogenedentota bacterium]
MGRQHQSISPEELADIIRQCASLHEDWRRFFQLASAPTLDDGAQRQLAFIQLQSRFSCDYPILSRWRAGNLGLSGAISKLVARAGTLEAFAREAQQGDGPLVRDWRAVEESIVRVRTLLDKAREQAKAGAPIKLPTEIAAPIEREPWPVRAMAHKAGLACAAVVIGGVVFLIARPFLLETSLFKWVDRSYTAWQIRNGVPGIDFPLPEAEKR